MKMILSNAWSKLRGTPEARDAEQGHAPHAGKANTADQHDAGLATVLDVGFDTPHEAKPDVPKRAAPNSLTNQLFRKVWASKAQPKPVFDIEMQAFVEPSIK